MPGADPDRSQTVGPAGVIHLSDELLDHMGVGRGAILEITREKGGTLRLRPASKLGSDQPSA